MSATRTVFGLMILFALAGVAGAPAHAEGASPPIPRDKPEPPDVFLYSAEGAAFKEALGEARSGRLKSALASLPPGTEPLIRDLVRWTAYISGASASFAELREFLHDRPDWPLGNRLRAAAETAIDDRVPDAEILAWFSEHPALGGEGKIRHAEALIRAGREAEAMPLLRDGWRLASLSTGEQKRMLARHGQRLTAADHMARVNRLLWQRARQPAAGLLGQLPAGERRLAEARMALIAFAHNVDGTVAKVPESLANDAGLVHDRVYWRRIKGKNEGARDLLLDSHIDGRLVERPDRWWQERHLQARRALREGRYEIAWRLAAEHGLLDGHETDEVEIGDDVPAELALDRRAQIADAEWLAGWIALRFLDRPAVALTHFTTMYGVVGYPVSLARGAYWAGRAADRLGDAALAARWFDEAARYPTTFYGQLARERSGGDLHDLGAAEASASEEERALFDLAGPVRAARLLARLGEDRLLGHFIRQMTQSAPTASARMLVAGLGAEFERPQIGVIAAKLASRSGTLIVERGYPLVRLELASPEQQSLAHAIARQESQFDPAAISHVGALGLMQLMPATANRVARQLNYPYSRERLLSDPAYNLELGTNFFATLLERFGGSPVLALAAYNAGPGAVDRWLKDFGDPRDMSADPLDWIELIPYGETRNYVQRVLEAAPVYGLRLADGAPTSLTAYIDLGRRVPLSGGADRRSGRGPGG